MMGPVLRWLAWKWRVPETAEAAQREAAQLIQDCAETFGTAPGRRVLQHLIDVYYCQVYSGESRRLADLHEGERAVVHDLLVKIDQAENPGKYRHSGDADRPREEDQ